jgi:hypothetical protein
VPHDVAVFPHLSQSEKVFFGFRTVIIGGGKSCNLNRFDGRKASKRKTERVGQRRALRTVNTFAVTFSERAAVAIQFDRHQYLSFSVE